MLCMPPGLCPFSRIDLVLAVCIQDLKLLVLVQKRLVLMLSVDIKKAGSCRLHLAYRAGFAVDLVDAPAVHAVLRVEKDLSVLQFDSKIPQELPLHA